MCPFWPRHSTSNGSHDWQWTKSSFQEVAAEPKPGALFWKKTVIMLLPWDYGWSTCPPPNEPRRKSGFNRTLLRETNGFPQGLNTLPAGQAHPESVLAPPEILLRGEPAGRKDLQRSLRRPRPKGQTRRFFFQKRLDRKTCQNNVTCTFVYTVYMFISTVNIYIYLFNQQ